MDLATREKPAPTATPRSSRIPAPEDYETKQVFYKQQGWERGFPMFPGFIKKGFEAGWRESNFALWLWRLFKHHPGAGVQARCGWRCWSRDFVYASANLRGRRGNTAENVGTNAGNEIERSRMCVRRFYCRGGLADRQQIYFAGETCHQWRVRNRAVLLVGAFDESAAGVVSRLPCPQGRGPVNGHAAVPEIHDWVGNWGGGLWLRSDDAEQFKAILQSTRRCITSRLERNIRRRLLPRPNP